MRGRLPIAAALAVLAAGCAGPAAVEQAAPGAGSELAGRVERVVDGDTLVVRAGGDRVRVRLLGIDTPESVRPDAPVECFGPEAARRAGELLPSRSPVRLVTDPTQDRVDDHGRLLAYAFAPGRGSSVNQRLVREGFARVYVYRGRAFRRLDAFRSAERAARGEGRGLWGRCSGAPAAPESPRAPSAPASGRACPSDRPVKGNLPSAIYHRPGDPRYGATSPERCFATVEDAELAGFRPPRGPR